MSELLSVLLERAKLPVTPDDYEHLERYLEVVLPQTDDLRIAEVRYAEPAVTFRAQPGGTSTANTGRLGGVHSDPDRGR